MRGYAKGTNVSSAKSKMEIERTLTRYGADQFMYGSKNDYAMIGFRVKNKMVKIDMPLPDRNAEEFTMDTRGWERAKGVSEKLYEKELKRRWRSLALVIKAKLEAVETGISTFEKEFLGFILLPGGQTVFEMTEKKIEKAISTSTSIPLLPGIK